MTAVDPPADLSPGEALSLHQAGAVTLLDVRELDEWAKGHAAGAVHIPLAALEPGSVDATKPIVTVCRSGNRSAKAAAKLSEAGLTVHNMAGGMSAWEKLGLPVQTDDGHPGTIA
jgi:rhodanese-related sulfurtransferase